MKSQKKPATTRTPAAVPRPPRREPAPISQIAIQILLPAATLLALVVVTYLPALDAEFIWDDETNVTNNVTLRSWDGLRQMWLVPRSIQQYYPLMYTTYWVEYRLWGLAPFGYHLVNVLLHATAAILFWRLLLRLNVPGAWLAAAIFAVHPVEVESVAWVTERKNVLSLSLAFLSMLSYLRFNPLGESATSSSVRSRWTWYALSGALFALALFAKTVVVTLPAVLLVIVWWKRGRLTWQDALPLLPFFVLSLAMGRITMWMETEVVGAHGDEWNHTLVERVLIAGRSLWFYIGKLSWPQPLALFYSRWRVDSHAWWQYLFPVAALTLPAGLWIARGVLGRGPLAAVLIFSGVMLPALGFFNIYFTQYAYVSDHFQYHASTALIALAAAGAALLTRRLRPAQLPLARGAAAALLAVLAIVAFNQTYIYHDLETLYRDTIAKNHDSWIAYLNLSTHLDSLGRDDEALEIARSGLLVKPDEPRLHACLGNVLGKLSQQSGDARQKQAAFAAYQEAVRLNPNYTDAYHSLGFMQLADNPAEAQRYFDRALALEPRDAHALYGTGAVAGLTGDWPRAQKCFEQALQIDPGYVDARKDLAIALLKQNQAKAAIEQLRIMVQMGQASAETHFELGNLLVAENDLQGAIRHYTEAVRLQPTYVDALQNLGAALLKMGDVERSVGYLREALRLQPASPQARANLERAQQQLDQRAKP